MTREEILEVYSRARCPLQEFRSTLLVAPYDSLPWDFALQEYTTPTIDLQDADLCELSKRVNLISEGALFEDLVIGFSFVGSAFRAKPKDTDDYWASLPGRHRKELRYLERKHGVPILHTRPDRDTWKKLTEDQTLFFLEKYWRPEVEGTWLTTPSRIAQRRRIHLSMMDVIYDAPSFLWATAIQNGNVVATAFGDLHDTRCHGKVFDYYGTQKRTGIKDVGFLLLASLIEQAIGRGCGLVNLGGTVDDNEYKTRFFPQDSARMVHFLGVVLIAEPFEGMDRIYPPFYRQGVLHQ